MSGDRTQECRDALVRALDAFDHVSSIEGGKVCRCVVLFAVEEPPDADYPNGATRYAYVQDGHYAVHDVVGFLEWHLHKIYSSE